MPPSPQPIGIPKVVRTNPEGHVVCKHCGCQTTCEIEVAVAVPEFKGGKGLGRHTGCPACGWKSPMDVIDGEYGT